MDTNTTVSANDLQAVADRMDEAHRMFGERLAPIVDALQETALDSAIDLNHHMTTDEMVMQIFMNWLEPNGPVANVMDGFEADIFEGKFTAEQKMRLVYAASYIGPDWAQALFHAARFITKVA